MNKNYYLFILTTAFIVFFGSCKSVKLNTSPSASLYLTFQEYGGYNSGAVTYNPKAKLYYAVIAGNIEFPLETFDEKGKPMSQTLAGFDSRGMWWNPNTKALERNGYGGNWTSNAIGSNGYITGGTKTIFSGMKQPNDNACGVFDFDANEVLFYNYGEVVRYNRNSGQKVGEITLQNINDDNILEYCMVYTGIKGKELGVVDYKSKQVYLFDKSNGAKTEAIQLPSNTVINERFGLAYANSYIWIYDPEMRTWTGFKIIG